jgi:hypothetical protein
LLGRGPQDCEAVLRSLDINTPRILWCIQGYVGNVLPEASKPWLSNFDRAALLDQIVIGHQQYQQAAHQSLAFRRAFAEVYRRRSLAFVGSGLAESYFVNLISEIVVNYGPSPRPHFALFSLDEYERNGVDGEFLRIRLGVTPVIYGDTYKELPEALTKVLPPKTRRGPDPHAVAVPRPLAVSFSVPRRRAADQELSLDDIPREVSLRFDSLPLPGPGECVVVSAGRDKTEGGRIMPSLGRQAQSFLSEHYPLLPDAGAPESWIPVPEADCLFQLKIKGEQKPVFALAVRELNSPNGNSLKDIKSETKKALVRIEQTTNFRKVFMGVLATGNMQFADPTISFIAQLAGVRRFTHDPSGSEHGLEFVEIRILNPNISAPVIEGRIPVRELLSSNLVRIFVRVADAAARQEVYTLDIGCDSTVGDALVELRSYNVYNIAVGQPHVEASPLPYPGFQPVEEARVFPMMTIEIRP